MTDRIGTTMIPSNRGFLDYCADGLEHEAAVLEADVRVVIMPIEDELRELDGTIRDLSNYVGRKAVMHRRHMVARRRALVDRLAAERARTAPLATVASLLRQSAESARAARKVLAKEVAL